MNDIPCRSFREDPPPTNPVILSARGMANTASVAVIDYVARRLRYDTEECILRALEDGEIELFYRDRLGDRSYDMYRLTAKGRRAYEKHVRGMFKRPGEMAKQSDQQEAAQAEPSAAAPEPCRPEQQALGVPA